MVAEGDPKDALKFLRVMHFRRKCITRKNYKKVQAEAQPLPALAQTFA